MSRGQVFVTAVLSAALAVTGLIAAQSAKTPKLTVDDYMEIQKLYADYSYALDQGEGERFAATFTEDGEFTGVKPPLPKIRKPLAGREALNNLASHGGPGSRHFLANLLITRTPEGAKASAYFLQFSTKTTPATLTTVGIYDDTLVKTPQGWKFKKRDVWRDVDELSPFKAQPHPAPPAAQ